MKAVYKIISRTIKECKKITAPDTGSSEDFKTTYVIDMAESAAVTVIATEMRSLRVLPFRPTEDQLTTG